MNARPLSRLFIFFMLVFCIQNLSAQEKVSEEKEVSDNNKNNGKMENNSTLENEEVNEGERSGAGERVISGGDMIVIVIGLITLLIILNFVRKIMRRCKCLRICC